MYNLDIWTQADDLNKEYISLKLEQIPDYEKFKIYSIVTNSTALEGSTLSLLDTQLLLDDGITAKGKPIEHHKMVQDNFEAVQWALQEADKKALVTPELLKKFNSLNLAQTGGIKNTIQGTIDLSTGNYRITPAFSAALGYYEHADKIKDSVNQFCRALNKRLETCNPVDLLKASFEYHANLILIHPWYDGNKRTSRLLMNFIQRFSGLPLTKINVSDSKEYLTALKDLKDNQNMGPIRDFMCRQHIKTIRTEIIDFNKQKRGISFVF